MGNGYFWIDIENVYSFRGLTDQIEPEYWRRAMVGFVIMTWVSRKYGLL